jgi:hypothetical protein
MKRDSLEHRACGIVVSDARDLYSACGTHRLTPLSADCMHGFSAGPRAFSQLQTAETEFSLL